MSIPKIASATLNLVLDDGREVEIAVAATTFKMKSGEERSEAKLGFSSIVEMQRGRGATAKRTLAVATNTLRSVVPGADIQVAVLAQVQPEYQPSGGSQPSISVKPAETTTPTPTST